jgi:hypothetical protein
MPTRALVFSAAILAACAACGRLKPHADASTAPDGGDAGGALDAATEGDAVAAPDADAAAAPDADAAETSADADAAVTSADVASEAPAGPPLTAAVVTTIDLPGIPVAAAYDGGTKKAYFACRTPGGASAGIAAVDDVTNAVVATITSGSVTALAANAMTKTVYAAEGALLDVIDSATDTISTTVKISDGSTIVGLAVDEGHNRTYVVTVTDLGTELFSLDGATNVLQGLRPPLLKPVGMPPVAVESASQSVFVLGVDSNGEGVIVTLDGPSGVPTKLASTKSHVDPSVSGIVPVGDGTAAVLLVNPGVVKRLQGMEVALPSSFAPAGVAAVDFGAGARALVVGFAASGAGAFSGFGVDTTSGALSPFGVPLDGGLPAGTTAARLLVAAPVPGGAEVYVDPTPDPESAAPFSPTRTIKLTVTAAPTP